MKRSQVIWFLIFSSNILFKWCFIQAIFFVDFMTTSNTKYPKNFIKIDKIIWILSEFSLNDLFYKKNSKINTKNARDLLLSSNIYFGCTGKVSYNVNMAHTKYKRTEPTPIVVWKNRNILRKSVLIFWFVLVKRSYNDV